MRLKRFPLRRSPGRHCTAEANRYLSRRRALEFLCQEAWPLPMEMAWLPQHCPRAESCGDIRDKHKLRSRVEPNVMSGSRKNGTPFRPFADLELQALDARHFSGPNAGRALVGVGLAEHGRSGGGQASSIPFNVSPTASFKGGLWYMLGSSRGLPAMTAAIVSGSSFSAEPPHSPLSNRSAISEFLTAFDLRSARRRVP